MRELVTRTLTPRTLCPAASGPGLPRRHNRRPRAVSSVGRAPVLQAGGRWFEPGTAHCQPPPHSEVGPRRSGYTCLAARPRKEGTFMLWLIAGIVLLIIAIAGGAIVHPVLFALAIVALVVFFMGRGTRTV